MRFDPWKCPECGAAAEGTCETLPGVAQLIFGDDGKAQYLGDTVLDWNGQRTIEDDEGRVTLVCPNGHAWQAQMECD